MKENTLGTFAINSLVYIHRKEKITGKIQSVNGPLRSKLHGRNILYSMKIKVDDNLSKINNYKSCDYISDRMGKQLFRRIWNILIT
jgi:hypothetical protein